jgi:hypothetical protein
MHIKSHISFGLPSGEKIQGLPEDTELSSENNRNDFFTIFALYDVMNLLLHFL